MEQNSSVFGHTCIRRRNSAQLSPKPRHWFLMDVVVKVSKRKDTQVSEQAQAEFLSLQNLSFSSIALSSVKYYLWLLNLQSTLNLHCQHESCFIRKIAPFLITAQFVPSFFLPFRACSNTSHEVHAPRTQMVEGFQNHDFKINYRVQDTSPCSQITLCLPHMIQGIP